MFKERELRLRRIAEELGLNIDATYHPVVVEKFVERELVSLKKKASSKRPEGVQTKKPVCLPEMRNFRMGRKVLKCQKSFFEEEKEVK